MVKNILLAGAAATVLSGCFQANTSQYPLASTYPISEQQKMQAAHHWDVLAEYEAGQIADVFPAERPLYIKGNGGLTAFDSAYKDLVTSHLVQQGMTVSRVPQGAAEVSYDVQVIQHRDRGANRAPRGAWLGLAAGVAVVANTFNKWSEPSLLLIPAAAVADVTSGSWVSDTAFEVLITTRISQGATIAHSSSNIYYINGGDGDHYAPAPKAEPMVEPAVAPKHLAVTDQE